MSEQSDFPQSSLEDVLITGELSRRSSRPPNYEAEAKALSELAGAMAGSPETIFQSLADAALQLCQADSAGVSILEPGDECDFFRWHAIAGEFSANVDGMMPVDASPCGTVIKQDATLLFSYPERHFRYPVSTDPPLAETLLVPFHANGKPVGTIWVIAHTPQKKFDAEDARLLTALSGFAAAAYQLTSALRDSKLAQSELEQRVTERTSELTLVNSALRGSEQRYRALFESIDEGFCVVEVLYGDSDQPVDYCFLEVNPAFEQLTGIVDAAGRSMRQIAPQHESHWFELYSRVARTGEAMRFEGAASALGRIYSVYAFRIGQPEQRRVAVLFSDVSESKRAEKMLQASEARQRYLLELSDALRPLDDTLHIQQAAMRVVGEHFQVDRVLYAELEDDGNTVSIADNYIRGNLPKVVGRFATSDFGNAAAVLRAGQTFVTADVDNDKGLPETDRDSLHARGIASCAIVPFVKNDRCVSCLGIYHREPREWTTVEIRLLQETAERTWAAFERARAEAALRASEVRLMADLKGMRRLDELHARLANENDLTTALKEILAVAVEFTGTDRGFVQLVNEDRERLEIVAYHGYSPESVFIQHCLKQGSEPASDVVRRHGQRMCIEDVATFTSLESTRHREIFLAEDIRATCCIPMISRKGALVGVLCTQFRRPHHPSDDELRLIDLLCWTAAEYIERHRTVVALRQSEERFRLMVEGARGFAMFTTDAEARITAWNPAAEALLGWTEKEAVGQPMEIIYTPEDRLAGRPDEEVAAALRFGRAVAGRWHIKKDLTRFWGSGELTVVAGTGAVPYGFVKVMRDDTARKLAEDALRESEERLRVAMSAADMGTWLWRVTPDEQIIDDSLRRLMGLQAGREVTTLDCFLQAVHVEDRERVRAEFQRCLAAGGDFNVEFRVTWPDGAVHWLRDRGKTFPVGGSPQFLTGAVVDVTERKRAEEVLQDADRRKDDFLALLAHELRNPLAPIRNGLQILRLSQQPEARERTQEMMDRQLTHMVRLIDDLLDVSRINRDKMELRRARVLLSDVLSSAIETARPSIEAAGHELVLALPVKPVFLYADLTRLAQVFSNLLTNSAKYTESGGKIRFAAQLAGETVVVEVCDNGTGIPAESLPHVFDMFSQVDRSLERASGGLGIGLALVKGLVEMHGGSVAAASEGVGRGSRFTVRLPVMSAESESPPVNVPAPVHMPAKRRILVVDDNRDSAQTMANMLHLWGNETALACDGVDAVERASIFRPDVILMDIGMPRLNGLDATRQIREQPWGHNMTIIALTGWGQESDRALSKEAGCDGHLVKPVSLADLEKMIDSVTGKS